jgi:pSer/pThr/pTyr-binding forkhead associated (FHA) protein
VSTVKIILPHLKSSTSYESFSASQANEAICAALDASAQQPCYLEVRGQDRQCYLFFREQQIYAAGKIENNQFIDTTVKDFLLTCSQMSSAEVTCFEVNNKILHSLLILFQKKPSVKVLTSLVDLDQVLDKIEDEGKSCIVSATQDSFLAVLRYEKGRVTALCHEQSLPVPKERDFRDDFLIKIYTLSAEKPLTITIYEDLLVKYAKDAKMIETDYRGAISDLFLSKPPILTLEFKDKEIGQWIVDRAVLNIGRTADNHVQIDNLAVSRLHAVIERDKGDFYVRDCDSLNGTLLNNKQVGRAKLRDGDEIVIGKHTVVFHTRSGKEIPLNPGAGPFDQTMIMKGGNVQPPPVPRVEHSEPRLVVKNGDSEDVIELSKASTIFGKDTDVDVALKGFFVAKHHAEIVRQNGDYVIRHLSGHKKVSVDGETVKERVLKDNDKIKIGNREFIFQK